MKNGPAATVDVIIEVGDRVVLIRRKNPPPGWAIPGGFVDCGETAENAAVREAAEENGLAVAGPAPPHHLDRLRGPGDGNPDRPGRRGGGAPLRRVGPAVPARIRPRPH